MCGAYGFSVNSAKKVYDRFEVVNTLPDFKPRWNLRPGQLNPVISARSPNQIQRMFWGFIPFFAKDKNYQYKTINAKAETVAELPTFRHSLRTKRCIVPATGFYEPDKANFPKPPHPWHFFRLKDEDLFGFAGLYDVWKDPQTGKEIVSYTIITTSPNSLVGRFHHRMPVILPKEDEADWLNPDTSEPAQLLPLLKPYPADRMEEWLVDGAARNPRNDRPEVMQPAKEVTTAKPEQMRVI